MSRCPGGEAIIRSHVWLGNPPERRIERAVHAQRREVLEEDLARVGGDVARLARCVQVCRYPAADDVEAVGDVPELGQIGHADVSKPLPRAIRNVRHHVRQVQEAVEAERDRLGLWRFRLEQGASGEQADVLDAPLQRVASHLEVEPPLHGERDVANAQEGGEEDERGHEARGHVVQICLERADHPFVRGVVERVRGGDPAILGLEQRVIERCDASTEQAEPQGDEGVPQPDP
eukprot:7378005-Prymnesium_polylepis.1